MDDPLGGIFGGENGKVTKASADIDDMPIRFKAVDLPQVILVETRFFDDPSVHGAPDVELPAIVEGDGGGEWLAVKEEVKGVAGVIDFLEEGEDRAGIVRIFLPKGSHSYSSAKVGRRMSCQALVTSWGILIWSLYQPMRPRVTMMMRLRAW